ncbi:PQQ-dependent sugar dehydrogenase [Algoriphagus boritolerans]|uniref:Glucose/arabinose dehydrogenase, beta-propeller fold n=1 Tax=Algoriphagus boritolerans DSM 17298 = JCM 18970 TaxID=1120964 RepID=A0A1H5WYL1_9BACT|nr:PQQ-dependent sugar dehydrogenase [Algoriphagus boritolerans]SEG04551.1 Glucose/arabinose dehydrogenase, beta-propeller fold [Algoriphagus boritolerans DSM 17298 = JCM 18970]
MNQFKPLVIILSLALVSLQTSCQSNSQEANILNGQNKIDISNAKAEVQLDQIKLQPGFKIEVWAGDVPNARSMAISDGGIVFVGNRQGNNVYALVDENSDGKADTKYILAEGLKMPNGVAYKDGDLFVAEVSRILRFKDIKNNLNTPSYEVVYNQYPTKTLHGWKFIAFGPDGMLYVPVGAPCNICESDEEIFASITRLDVDTPGSKPEIVAHGVRNTVGFDWHPETKELWFTENGRDMLGDDTPDCELNRVAAEGQHFGYPYWHAGTVKDPDFGSRGKDASAYVAPAAKLGAHVAPLGMRFYKGTMFPTSFKNQIIIAKHGSWNRSKKSGYEVVLTELDNSGNVTEQKVFASGWLDEASQEVWGRPVDVQELPDGSLLISDDMAGCIYRVSYSK